jgi:undecaprenyl diphosphate synthase
MKHETTHSPASHVAVIMDGNGRWAASRRKPRSAGHVAGAAAARKVVEEARRVGVRTLTLYAFSSDNWQRPRREVMALMRLFRRYLLAETERCVANGIRLRIIGRRDRIAPELLLTIQGAEKRTAGGKDMLLRVAVDYSSRDVIARTAMAMKGTRDDRASFAAAMGEVDGTGEPVPDVDLLIRTGGEHRLSDFLLWECAYAELYFSTKAWPEFGPADLDEALAEFARRNRRFGAIPEVAAG